jgi:hypothetical protein
MQFSGSVEFFQALFSCSASSLEIGPDWVFTSTSRGKRSTGSIESMENVRMDYFPLQFYCYTTRAREALDTAFLRGLPEKLQSNKAPTPGPAPHMGFTLPQRDLGEFVNQTC